MGEVYVNLIHGCIVCGFEISSVGDLTGVNGKKIYSVKSFDWGNFQTNNKKEIETQNLNVNDTFVAVF